MSGLHNWLNGGAIHRDKEPGEGPGVGGEFEGLVCTGW